MCGAGNHQDKALLTIRFQFKSDSCPLDMRYLKWSFLADDTVFVPLCRVHTQISRNVGDLSMVVPYEREADVHVGLISLEYSNYLFLIINILLYLLGLIFFSSL